MTALIRLGTLDDLDAIRDIYNYYVEHSTCTYQIEPETASERLAWFQEREARHVVTVAECDDVVVGWAALSPWKSRCGYRLAAEGSVYLHHTHQRRGLGRLLLSDLIQRAKEHGFHTIIGGASADQTGSLALQRSLGFQEVGRFRQVGRKFDQWLDVIYMQLMIG